IKTRLFAKEISPTVPKPSGAFARSATYWTVFRPLAGTQVRVGSPKSGPEKKASRRRTGSGVVLNSKPRARVRCFHGGATMPRFSSHIATHGKSLLLKQYAMRRPSFRFTAATKPTFFVLSNKTATTNPRP